MYTVRTYPDPVLTKPAEPVTEFGRRLEQIIEEMFLTMYREHGLGLAAPQVGISRRIYVINTEEGQPKEAELALVNPQVVSVEGDQFGEEGCLSFPGLFARKQRPARVTMRAQDARGRWFEVTGEGIKARALLHELDHLEGKVFVQDLEPVEYVKIRKRLELMRREAKRAKVRA